jgi:ArsR family transcriptional regulator, nickel/cobalt-responsive transcriptional repressor
MTDPLDSKRCSRLLKALADPERLKIVQALRLGPACVSEIAEQLNEVVANVSHHLRVLRKAGLVVDRRRGKNIIYALHPDIFLRTESKPGTLDVLDFGCCRLELGSERPRSTRRLRTAASRKSGSNAKR